MNETTRELLDEIDAPTHAGAAEMRDRMGEIHGYTSDVRRQVVEFREKLDRAHLEGDPEVQDTLDQLDQQVGAMEHRTREAKRHLRDLELTLRRFSELAEELDASR